MGTMTERHQGTGMHRGVRAMAVIAAALSGLTAQAQPATSGQTAEGAQKFLATLVAKGHATTWFVDAQNRRNHVRTMAKVNTFEYGVFADAPSEWQKPIEKQLLPFTIHQIDTLGPNGKPDACMTRLAAWRVNANEQRIETQTWRTTKPGVLQDRIYEHRLTGTHEPSPELLGPHWIDWRHVDLARAPEGTQMTVSFKGKVFTAHLAFNGETELIDRVEYAMKFLKMSCDDSAATGF